MAIELIEESDLARAWAHAFRRTVAGRGREASPLVVKMTFDGAINEDGGIRRLVDQELGRLGLTTVNTVANTIFPVTLWSTQAPRDRLFKRFQRIWPRIKKDPANRSGTYFQRFVAFGAKDETVNQLEHVIQTYKGGNHRRSALQLAVFDPTRDHSNSRQSGFPCLHQVAVLPTEEGLRLAAFYGLQLMLEKAYGNYLGLARLGEFIAHELGIGMLELTCVASVAKVSQAQGFKAANRNALEASISSVLGGEA